MNKFARNGDGFTIRIYQTQYTKKGCNKVSIRGNMYL